MPRGWRPCPKPGCPEPTPPSQRYCDEHLAEYEAKRGTKSQRGYDSNFREQRKRIAPKVLAGLVDCWRCGQRIEPGEPFDMGHDDHDRSIIRGPEHSLCNRSAAGKSAHQYL